MSERAISETVIELLRESVPEAKVLSVRFSQRSFNEAPEGLEVLSRVLGFRNEPFGLIVNSTVGDYLVGFRCSLALLDERAVIDASSPLSPIMVDVADLDILEPDEVAELLKPEDE